MIRILISFLISLPFWWGINYFQENLENYFYAQISQPLQEIFLVKIPEKPQKPEISLQVRSAIAVKVYEGGNQKILFKENIDKPLPIASLTKLMTALIVLENTPDDDFNLSNVVTISKEAAGQEDVPIFGNLKSEDKLLLERVLDLMLIYSSNDAAFALSEVIGTKNFVEKMNQKAKELGLKNTNFINPTGLDPENLHYDESLINYFNYSTAKDLVKLSQYIFKEYPKIFEISLSKGPYLIKNGTSDLVLPEGFKILGGKTGYTDEAGGCMLLVMDSNPPSALPQERAPEKGNKIINVILGTPSSGTRIEEMQKLINWLAL